VKNACGILDFEESETRGTHRKLINGWHDKSASRFSCSEMALSCWPTTETCYESFPVFYVLPHPLLPTG
jgi:hypothetical protein